MRKISVVVLLILATVLTMCGCALGKRQTLQINGTEITQFQIIYAAASTDDHAKAVAKDLGERLSEKYGVEFVVGTDKTKPTDHEIIIGDTTRDVSGFAPVCDKVEKYSISSDGSHVAITAGGHKGMASAVEEFIELIGLEKPLEETPENVTIGAGKVKKSKLYSAMTFNILYTYDEDRWPLVFDMIYKYMPDTIGFQETNNQWNMYFPFVKKFNQYYELITFPYRNGNGGGTNELIAFRKDRFKLISTDTKWVSMTPDIPSMVVGASLHRIINFAVLEDLQTGEQIIHANTHMEHQVVEANMLQVECLKEILKPYEGKNIIVTGDFNAVHSKDYGLGSKDTYFSDPRYYADYVTKRPTTGGNGAIDYCWTARDTIHTKYYHVAAEMLPYGNGKKQMYPSDHRPVYIVYELASN